MKLIKSAWFIILLTGFCFAQNAPKVYFNEVRANDASTDDVEFLELIAPAGTNLEGMVIVHYNGNASQDTDLWSHTIGNFIVPNDGITDEEGVPLGFYIYGAVTITNVDESNDWSNNMIQNGEDGLILYDSDPTSGGLILDAIAWDGAGDLIDDDPGTVIIDGLTTSNNYLAVTIDDDDDDNSLQAPNAVFSDNGNNWILDAATPGAINVGQASGSIQLTSSETTRPVAMLTSASGNPLTITATLSDGQTGIVSIEVKTLTDASLTIDGTSVNVNDIFTTYAKASLDITATGSSSASRINLIISDAVGNETVWFFDFMQ